MCLAVPLKITEINGNDAVGERDGITRNIRLDLIKDPQPGQYVIVHAGFAIERLSEEQAEADIAAARELEAAIEQIYLEDKKRRESAEALKTS